MQLTLELGPRSPEFQPHTPLFRVPPHIHMPVKRVKLDSGPMQRWEEGGKSTGKGANCRGKMNAGIHVTHLGTEC
jgi:hypothetical protein